MIIAIIFHVQSREESKMLQPNFLEHNTEVNGQMRAVLVDWLIQVQVNNNDCYSLCLLELISNRKSPTIFHIFSTAFAVTTS